MAALYQRRVVALNKEKIIEHILAGRERKDLPIQLQNALGSYTKPSSKSLDPDFNKQVRELAPHYFRNHLSVPKSKPKTQPISTQATAHIANAAQQTAFIATETPPKRKRKATQPVIEGPPPPPRKRSFWERIGGLF